LLLGRPECSNNIIKVDLVFYDLTTTYFCRKSPLGELRRHGHGKDGKPRQVQVVVGVVMANGFPIAHHVFAGNQSEKTTFQDVLTDVDRLGIPGRRCQEAAGVFDALDDTKWQRVDEENSVQEIRLPDGSERYFVIDSVQRKAYEEGQR